MHRLLNIFYILFCFQIGIFLVIYPWLRIWEVNGLLIQHPALRQVMLNNYFRGAVSGLGIVNLLIGGIEFINFTRKRNSH
ncbi:MAG TPA: hypothetical protein VGK99_20225 [Acidobacteriota bacterium]